jgi:hypothetical protein
VDSDFNGGYGSALGAEVCSVGCNVWEMKNIQTALLSEMLFFKEKLGLQNFCLLYGGIACISNSGGSGSSKQLLTVKT